MGGCRSLTDFENCSKDCLRHFRYTFSISSLVFLSPTQSGCTRKEREKGLNINKSESHMSILSLSDPQVSWCNINKNLFHTEAAAATARAEKSLLLRIKFLTTDNKKIENKSQLKCNWIKIVFLSYLMPIFQLERLTLFTNL